MNASSQDRGYARPHLMVLRNHLAARLRELYKFSWFSYHLRLQKNQQRAALTESNTIPFCYSGYS